MFSQLLPQGNNTCLSCYLNPGIALKPAYAPPSWDMRGTDWGDGPCGQLPGYSTHSSPSPVLATGFLVIRTLQFDGNEGVNAILPRATPTKAPALAWLSSSGLQPGRHSPTVGWTDQLGSTMI
jgi:hypothetical protein